MLRRSKPFRPTISSISSTFGRISSSVIFFRRRPKATFSNTFRCGNSAYFWNTVFTGRLYGGMLAMSLPSKKTLPDFGVTKPAITRRVVVLPQPEGPRKVTNSLSWMSSESPSRTFCPSNSTTMSFRDTIRFSFIFIASPFAEFPVTALSLRTVSSLGRHRVLDESASIMPPRKGLLHGFLLKKPLQAAHTTPMCQGRKDLPYRCTHKVYYTACGMFVNKNLSYYGNENFIFR